MKYVVSACLAGECCRYDGKPQPDELVMRLVSQGRAVPLCPEVLGGLSVPRLPCEKRQGDVFTAGGSDCTMAFIAGAVEGLRIAQENGCTAAILKARSPSCGSGQIYDGTFSHRIVPGDGVFAELLRREGFLLFSEENLPAESIPKTMPETLSDVPATTQKGCVISAPTNKTGILLVAFGPGTVQSEAALRRVQQRAECRFGLPVRLAFTSDLIRERLARARTKSDSVLKALQRMKFERYTHVAVQSLHLIPGLEYADVLADAAVADALRMQVGLPLLNNEQDVRTAAKMLLRHLPADRKAGEAVVCMAHGSRHESEWLYEVWSKAVSELDPLVFVACMKGRVTLDTVLPQLEALRPERVWLLPLLSVVGKHTLQDMAGTKESGGQKPLVAASWKSRIEDAGLVCVPDLRGLADGPEFVDAWLDRLDAALKALNLDA